MINIQQLLKEAVQKGASDLHLKANHEPIFRINTQLEKGAEALVDAQTIIDIIKLFLPEQHHSKIQSKKEIDFSFMADCGERFRVNLFWQRETPALVFRHVKKKISTFDELHLPSAKLIDLLKKRKGIVLLGGPTGCGKSTTLAAMVDYLNMNFNLHIVTIEDPIEYIFEDKKSIINQQEVGIDTSSFAEALKYVLRHDPDVIVIGEMRDPESFLAALSAAETGHLVLATLHISNAAQAIIRVMDFFPAKAQHQVRMQLAQSLNAVICQRLIPSLNTKVGVVPAVEIMMADELVKKLIRENRLDKVQLAIDKGVERGMLSINRCLVELVEAKMITKEDALANAPNPETLKLNLQGIFLDEEKGIINI